jgi:sulfatase modifying factor 1
VPHEVLDPLKRRRPARWRARQVGAIVVSGTVLVCCANAVVSSPALPPGQASSASTAPPTPSLGDAAPLDATAAIDAFVAPDDPMALHLEAPDSLRTLMGAAAGIELPIGGPWRLGQGNRSIARHSIGHRACEDGLRDVVIQTPEQRSRCGEEAMVPVWSKGGNLGTARFCIDVFEFPNRACELPFVFVTPSQADRICRMQSKRLCTQDEWDLACRGDPNGGADRTYAYGDELDLAVCNTDKSKSDDPCDISTQDKLWSTCSTDTEPSGAFTRCRSRFGVFDQHGNVAEIMTRFEPADGEVKSQLKGSAFFYVDVAKKPGDPGGYWTKYPDHCNFDPRWHVEKLDKATHMNYHLGFRCCRSLVSADAAAE